MLSERILAFDVGTQWVGTAVANTILRHARPLPVLKMGDWVSVDHLLKQWQPHHVVVGFPLTQTGEEQWTSVLARAFSQTLGRRRSCTVHCVDERFTTQLARDWIAREPSKKFASPQGINSIAAVLILNQWMLHKKSMPQ